MNTARALQELDLRPGATEEEIRDAYRKLVTTWHPDKYQNDPARLHEAELRIKNINAAFEKLQANGFRTERNSRKANDGSKKASSTSTEDRKNSEQATRGQDTKSSARPFYKSMYLRSTAWLICVFFAFILGLMNSSEVGNSNEVGKSDGDYKKQIKLLQKTIASLTKETVSLEEQAKVLLGKNEQLKSKINLMMQPTYAMEQAKKFSQEEQLELAATWKEETDPKFKIELVNKIIPPRLDDLSENVAGLYYWAIGPARQKRVLEPAQESPPDPDSPQNISDLQELVREISDAKDKAWLPFYTEMLGVRSEACRIAVEKLNTLLGNIVGQEEWETFVREARKRITEEQKAIQMLHDLKPRVVNNNSINSLKQEFENIKYWDWINLDEPIETGESSLYKSGVIFKHVSKSSWQHWPKSESSRQGDKRLEAAKFHDKDYKVIGLLGQFPEVVVIEMAHKWGGKGIWLWVKKAKLVVPLEGYPYVAREISEVEANDAQRNGNKAID